MSEEIYSCPDCDKTYKTRAGLWKHQKRYKHGKFAEAESEYESEAPAEAEAAATENAPAEAESVPISESPAEDAEAPTSDPPSAPTEADHAAADDPAGDTRPSWMDFKFTAADDTATDAIPTHFKAAVASGGAKNPAKLTKAEKQALMKRNTAILKLGLTTTDHLLTKYAQAVCMDPEMKVEHSEADKDLVANAQMAYLEEKGLFITNYLSTGVVAASLTAWYIGAPVMRIRKKAKRKLFKGRGLLSKLPLIGRFFKRKQTIETGELRIHEQ